jgi:hypothetical protein
MAARPKPKPRLRQMSHNCVKLFHKLWLKLLDDKECYPLEFVWVASSRADSRLIVGFGATKERACQKWKESYRSFRRIHLTTTMTMAAARERERASRNAQLRSVPFHETVYTDPFSGPTLNAKNLQPDSWIRSAFGRWWG